MKIGILQTGLCPDELIDEHGEYDAMFARFLDGHGFEFDSYRVLEGVLPSSVHDADGWLITGSKYGAYEDHEWIPPLEEFLRQVYAQKIPMVGICFGHQILAQALGGKVEKFSGGWSVGKQHYEVDGIEGGVDLMAWHQDQIVELPQGARAVGSSPFCQYAFVAYGDTALSVQPHPEFSKKFIHSLFDARKEVLPAEVMAHKDDDYSGPLSTSHIADMMARILKQEHLS